MGLLGLTLEKYTRDAIERMEVVNGSRRVMLVHRISLRIRVGAHSRGCTHVRFFYSSLDLNEKIFLLPLRHDKYHYQGDSGCLCNVDRREICNRYTNSKRLRYALNA